MSQIETFQQFAERKQRERVRSLDHFNTKRAVDKTKRFQKQIVHQLQSNAQSYTYSSPKVELKTKQEKFTYSELMKSEETRSENIIVKLIRLPETEKYAFLFIYGSKTDFSDIKVHKIEAAKYATEFLYKSQNFIDGLLDPRKKLNK